MFFLDYQDRRPIYEQVAEKFQELILSGVLLPGERMPSVRQMAVDLSVNPNTIQRAYMELEQRELIYPVKGKGNYVADSQKIKSAGIGALKGELQKLVRKGIQAGLREEDMQQMVHDCCQEEKV